MLFFSPAPFRAKKNYLTNNPILEAGSALNKITVTLCKTNEKYFADASMSGILWEKKLTYKRNFLIFQKQGNNVSLKKYEMSHFIWIVMSKKSRELYKLNKKLTSEVRIPKEKLPTNLWKYFSGIILIFGFVIAILTLLPRIAVVPGPTVDQSNAFSAPFTLTNNGIHIRNKITYWRCSIY